MKAENCCEVLDMVLERGGEKSPLRIETAFSLSGKPTRELLVYRFRKATNGDSPKFGKGSRWADSTYAVCLRCPFCGAEKKGARDEG